MYIIDPKRLEKIEAAKGVTRQVIPFGDRLMFVLFEFQPNASVPEHRHPEEQIGLVLRGKAEFNVEGKVMVAEEGMVYWFPPNVKHGAKVGADGGLFLDVFSPPRKDFTYRTK